ncbi:AAA family ATPase [Shewanella algae]|uniref:AAA family ATPase n=1 Tax=Shewanella algae TaxID=38313 RepID=UPI0031F5A296
MNIEQITLKNFRRFATLTVPLHPQLTVLVAPNGAGKSTILDAIAVAVSPFVAAFDLGKGRSIAKSDARYQRMEQATSSEQMFPVEIAATFREPACETKRALTGLNNKTTIKEASDLVSFGDELMLKVRNLEAVTLPVVAYYGTGRLWQEHRNMERKSVLSASRSLGYEDCLSTASNYKQLQQWFSKATLAELQQQQMADVYQGYSLKEQIEGIQVAIETVLKPSAGWQNFHYSFSHEELVMSHPEQGVLPVSLLSDGVRAMVSLVADLAWRCTKLNPQLGAQAAEQTSGLVLIDEVDMFLHPAWQQQVLGALQQAFPNIQFVVTTHSPQVISTVHDDCIRIITGEQVCNAPQGTQGAESARILRSVFGVEPRPKSDPMAALLANYLDMVYADKWHDPSALQLRARLDEHFGLEEPALTAADLYIENKLWERSLEEDQ